MSNQAPPASINTSLAGIIKNYDAALGAGVAQAVPQVAGMIDVQLNADAQVLGWLSAGSMYMPIARLNSTISAASQYAPSAVAPNMEKVMAQSKGSQTAEHDPANGNTVMVMSLNGDPPDLSKLAQIVNEAANLIATQGAAPTAFTLQSGNLAAGGGPETNTDGLMKVIDYVADAFKSTFKANNVTATGGNSPGWLGPLFPWVAFRFRILRSLAQIS
jgi:hypothetical protein